MTKKVLVLQHIEIEDLAFLKKLFIDTSFNLTVIKFFESNITIPNLKDFDLMIVLGGPMDTWMEKEYPWLKKEKEIIKKFVFELNKPFLGLCLGCQLLGEILGAKIKKSKCPEIGFIDVNLSKIGLYDNLFFNFPKKFKAFHWHSYEVTNLSKISQIKVLGSSKITPVQIFKFNSHAYGIQFHLEIERNTISKWLSNKIYKEGLIDHFGERKIKELKVKQKKYIKSINKLCETMFQNLQKILG